MHESIQSVGVDVRLKCKTDDFFIIILIKSSSDIEINIFKIMREKRLIN